MVVLDTHVLIWWVNGDQQLSGPAAARIEQELGRDSSLLVSAISAWEVAMLINKGRLALAMEIQSWLAKITLIPSVKFMPVDTTLAVQSTLLPGTFHNDPADRMIVALAREQSVPLITADRKIQSYDHVKTLW
jgi:PIN domain nuclease of toxin-antitoxin system